MILILRFIFLILKILQFLKYNFYKFIINIFLKYIKFSIKIYNFIQTRYT